MTNQPPPLDAERVSDERLAEFIQDMDDGIFVQPYFLKPLLRELQRLRATQVYTQDHIDAAKWRAHQLLSKLKLDDGATQRESGGESVSVPASKLLELRAALVGGSVAEAYHVLYSIVSPRFDKPEPFAELEALSASQRKECE